MMNSLYLQIKVKRKQRVNPRWQSAFHHVHVHVHFSRNATLFKPLLRQSGHAIVAHSWILRQQMPVKCVAIGLIPTAAVVVNEKERILDQQKSFWMATHTHTHTHTHTKTFCDKWMYSDKFLAVLYSRCKNIVIFGVGMLSFLTRINKIDAMTYIFNRLFD